MSTRRNSDEAVDIAIDVGAGEGDTPAEPLDNDDDGSGSLLTLRLSAALLPDGQPGDDDRGDPHRLGDAVERSQRRDALRQTPETARLPVRETDQEGGDSRLRAK